MRLLGNVQNEQMCYNGDGAIGLPEHLIGSSY
ncbi:MAG: hypothetical protein GFH27_549289n343 [Chloroflexi bacterium AL-W]|nr:hypothetical protein [Chloroflexi bacterium AL-N1]NOK67075.1 hypothetical protein [Chloroflexi bacterium AL-N10]NOK74633.1 hypothetical protein [Chloroflexi bacterium AL-N5]NOK81677.1 hypothetical protein [Chloroflexi bacterium AL-W]NOK89147.1 hypothetical protein [Chloroflexi bacterium AL-N15]